MMGKVKTTQGRVLVLADDLTGALEAGAKFAGQGIATLVAVDEGEEAPKVSHDFPVLVLDMETRHVSPDEAARRVYEQVRRAVADGFTTIYKKTDSTLRGNIGSELRGLWEACPGSGLLYVPAYPKMGRTVKGGVLHVDGQPVSTTEFGFDALNPVGQSSIPRLLASHIPSPIVSIDEKRLHLGSGDALYVCDADSEEEVEGLARFFVESGVFSLAAGPSAFLHYLARQMKLPRRLPPPLPRVRRALIVNGSRNKRSAGQIRYAKENGFPVVDSAKGVIRMGDRGWGILGDRTPAAESSDEAAARMAKKVVSILNKTEIEGLVIFGGDTAYAVIRALGQLVIRPIGEVLEGIPVSLIRLHCPSRDVAGSERDIVLVTKAGGFGPTNVLPTIRNALA